jgi:penicillin-binding protein 1C
MKMSKSWLLRCGLAFLAIATLGWWALPFALPLPEKLVKAQQVSPTYLASDGSPLRQLLTTEGQRVSAPIPYADLPQNLIQATLAVEDKRFFSHGGIDLLAISRAAWDNLQHQRVVSGASTITQQLVKISSEKRNRRTLKTKLVEALQARRLEMTWNKERILSEYLNRISYGNLMTGCSSAAQGYFNKPLRDLTPAECAMLAALPQSPSRLNPYRNLKAVQKRQAHVLDNMRQNEWLTEEALTLALSEKPNLQRFTGGFAAPHAVELMQATVTTPVIRTTLDPNLQAKVETIITNRLAFLEQKHVTQAAAVVIENSTGKVLALAGSQDFFASAGGQINGAWTPHSPGSALKPFTYLLALQQGFTAASIIPDLPIEYATTTGLYRPENYDLRHHGPVTLRMALGSSLNIPAVRVLQEIGGETKLHSTLQALGLTTLTEKPEHYGLGLTIGNAPVRLLELANAYACLARLGEAKPWSLLAETYKTPATRPHSAAACYVMADILSDNQARVMTFGPQSIIRLPFPCAVKTGTSTNYRDNWTLGYTPEFTVAVWAGNFDNTPMNEVSGVTGAGPIFREIFIHLHESRGTSWYAPPAELIRKKIDPRNGRSLQDGSPATSVSLEEWFIPGTVPAIATTADYEPQTGKAYISRDYESWLQSSASGAWSSNLTLREQGESLAAPRIMTPVNGTIIYLDPDLKDQGRKLLLRAAPGPLVAWSSPTLSVFNSEVNLLPGQHEIIARNPSSGESSRVRIEVRHPPTMADRLLKPAAEKPDPPVRQ